MASNNDDNMQSPLQSIQDSDHDQPHSDESAAPLEHDLEVHFNLTLHLHGEPVELPFYHDDATIQDLSDTVDEVLRIPPTNQKFLITPKTGLLRPPFKDAEMRLQTLKDKKIVLMGATSQEVNDLQADIAARQLRIESRRNALRAGRKVRAEKSRDWKKIQDEARYTFHTLRPLPYLPNPEKSMRYLERLRDDAGIKATMRKHGFSVGLLTEMNPAEHTTHESKTLGLNRNAGEVIELRLRTDAYDGYRDYKVIRKTLCHELTHNVWGDHDSRFWKLCKEIEAEVDKNDWRSGGHSVGNQEFFNPEDPGIDDDDLADEGGWTGGEYVLGGSSTSSLSRREIMARAAEDRIRKMDKAKAAEKEAKES